jgi:hypothetical protein
VVGVEGGVGGVVGAVGGVVGGVVGAVGGVGGVVGAVGGAVGGMESHYQIRLAVSIMDKLKGGWAMDRERFTWSAVDVFNIAVDHRRLGLKLGDDAWRGERFNDDVAILARLESMFTEGEFMECPGARIDAALIDAAQSDHWYTTEKKYDCDYGPSDEMEIAEGDDNE